MLISSSFQMKMDAILYNHPPTTCTLYHAEDFQVYNSALLQLLRSLNNKNSNNENKNNKNNNKNSNGNNNINNYNFWILKIQVSLLLGSLYLNDLAKKFCLVCKFIERG